MKTKTDIYDIHRKAFDSVSAYVVLNAKGTKVATVALKFGNSGRVTAFVHYLGAEMVKGYAGGGGYDKQTAACSSAADKLSTNVFSNETYYTQENLTDAIMFKQALSKDNGRDWWRCLEDAGFQVLQAV